MNKVNKHKEEIYSFQRLSKSKLIEMDKTNEFLELLASKISVDLMNDLYNGTYKYTLTKYRDMLRDVITNYQKKDTCPDLVKMITLEIIDAFLVRKIQTEYYPLVSARIKEIEDQ